MYHALYRKYRPIDFDSVVGQDIIVKTLKNSIVNNSFSHAYIFYGSRGTGKTTLSKIFARNVNCLNPQDGSACGKCENCLVSFSKECVDIIEIDAASNNGVDEIRELRSKISLVPSKLKYKVYIIDEVHMLSSGAFNALLKTLEEPPEHAIFILATTELQKVPETIVSRCQCFSFKRIPDSCIVDKLSYVCKSEKIKIEDKVLYSIAKYSNGGLRDALGLLDKLSSFSTSKITYNDFLELNGSIALEDINSFINYLFNGDVENVLKSIDNFHNMGKNFIQIIYQIIDYLRDCIISYYSSNKSLDFSLDYYYYYLNILVDKIYNLKNTSNIRLLFEIISLKFINDFITKKFDEVNNNNDITDSKEVVDNSNVSSSINNDIDDEEYDFSKDMDISSDTSVVYPKIININEIMNIRINNTFAKADKSLLKVELNNFEKLRDFTFDQEIGYIVCSLLDSKVRVVSDENIIISFQYDSNVKQNLNLLDKFHDVYLKITNSSKNFAIISDLEWDNLRLQYINNLKNNIPYTIKKEPEVLFEETENNDIINNRAIDLFGDIVEID